MVDITTQKLYWDCPKNDYSTGNTLIRIYDDKDRLIYQDRIRNEYVDSEIISLRKKYQNKP